MVLQLIPPYIRDMRAEWHFSPLYSPYLQTSLRKGCTVSFPRQFDTSFSESSLPILCVLESGGAGTIWAKPLSMDDATLIRLAQVKQYVLPGSYSTYVGMNGSNVSLEDLCLSRGCLVKYCSNLGTVDNVKDYYLDARSFIVDILSLLPSLHMGDSFFHTLILGGGGSATKYGCYENGTVQIYDSSLKFSLRNLVGITLHEIGHSLHVRGENQSFRFVLDMQEISKNIGQFGFSKSPVVDYLGGFEERFNRAQIDVSEFIAESYVWYVVNGMKMKNSSITLYRDLYDLLRGQFGGRCPESHKWVYWFVLSYDKQNN